MDKDVRVITQDETTCILWVSGHVISISQIVQWIGGFIAPIHDDRLMYTYMHTEPAGGTEGDIIVVLTDDLMVLAHNSYSDLVESKLSEWEVLTNE